MNEYQKFINFLNTVEGKPKLLLHCCCGPCSTHVIDLLKEHFNITVFFSNSNIYPEEEFKKREDALLEVCRYFHIENYVLDTYNHHEFLTSIKGLELLGENSQRCFECMKYRIKRATDYAIENDFAYVTTTLSISPHKSSLWINEIGVNESNIFLYSNFKKDNGFLKSVDLSTKLKIYRQNYCGCEFSLRESIK